MSDPFLLCDPGLLLPPGGESVERHQEFWRHLVEWSADRRLRLGLQGREAVMRHLNLNGWPDYSPPHCPTSIKRDARRAVNRLLAAVAHDPPNEAADVPELDPVYTKDTECGIALALDIVEQHNDEMLAAASHEGHWQRSSGSVVLDPPPPEEVVLAFEPKFEVETERVMRAAGALDKKRLKIIGGKRKQNVEGELEKRFAIKAGKITWIEAEKSSQPDLYKLDGVRAERDVVICVTGKIGHAGRDKVRELAAGSGIEPLLVEKVSDIVTAIQDRYGD
jgi:hypothetical protein